MIMHAKRKNTAVTESPSKSQFLSTIIKVLVVLTAITILWHGYMVTKPSNAPIKRVDIIASYQHLDPQTLQQIIIPYTGNGFYYLNVFGVKHQLLKLPWVYSVSITRKWPDTITVNIAEQQPIAQWGENALINIDGDIFYPEIATFPKNLPSMFGPENQQRMVFQTYQKMQQLLAPLQQNLVQLTLSSPDLWHLTLASGTTILISDQEPLVQLKQLVKLYPQISQGHNNPPKSIDMRYNNGLAIKWN